MTILVTGSKGKLGSRVLAELGDQGRGYDLQDGQNILDRAELLAAMQGCEAVVHCAGIPHPGAGDYADYLKTNVLGTHYVCEAARQAGVRRLVYTSSTAFYGCDASHGFEPHDLPVNEKHRPNPVGAVSAYGVSKRMVEEMLVWYGTNRVFETVRVRSAPANPKSGQYPEGFDWASCGDYRRKALWANCHPDYAARALVLAVRHPEPLWCEVFLVVDKYAPTCVDVKAFLDRDYPELMLYAKVDPLMRGLLGSGLSLFSSTKAQEVLGWEPCNEKA